MSVDASPLAPAVAVSGTRKRLDHIDAMRPVKQFGVVSTHTLIAFAPLGTGISVGAALQLLHVTREAFLFISACMIAYSFRGVMRVELRSYWRRRFMAVGVPYLCWTVIYFFLTLHGTSGSLPSRLDHLAYLVGTGYYQLYFLVVLLQFYVIFPLLLLLLRRTVGHHAALLVASAALQVLVVSLMHWGVLPHWMRGFWATREVTSYQFYLIAGMVVALHLDQVHHWLCTHVRLVLGLTLVSAALAEAWYYLAVYHDVSWFGSSSDPFQPVVIPWNLGAIACIYLLGVWLVGQGRSARTRALTKTGSDDSYGIYLAQLVFITALGWFGWRHLNHALPWPLLSLLTVLIVFLACIALTEVLARTALAKPLTGRSRVLRRIRGGVPPVESGPGVPAVPTIRPQDPVGAATTGG
jgi:peptidoglycan/LPS O-acetylase OafA/YrhL